MSLKIATNIAEVRVTYQAKTNETDHPLVNSSEKAERVFRQIWDEETIEFFEEAFLLLVDNNACVMGWYKVSQGGMTGTVVDPRIVFATALKGRANAIILAHNHPSGKLKPSQADLRLTERLFAAGQALNLPLLDHLILAPDGGYFSFADEGLINH